MKSIAPKAPAAISIVDVAHLANVGVGTVSRVINNHPSVRPATAEAVQQAMATLGYTPPSPGHRRGMRRGPARSAPAQSRIQNLTLIILADYGLDWILRKAPVFASVLQGIQSRTEAAGGALTIRQASGWPQLIETLRQSKGTPCLVMGEEPPAPPPALPRFGPIVWVMGSIRHFDRDHVQPDHFSLGQIAARHVQQRGHRRAAYIGVPINPAYHVSFRGLAFQSWLETAGVTVDLLTDPGIIISGPREHHADEAVLGRLIKRFATLPTRPTALLLQADMLTPVIYSLLREEGIKPMVDVEILTCNNEPSYLAQLKPRPLVLDLQAKAIGRRAVEQVLWRSENPHEPAMRIMVEPLLLDLTADTSSAT
jgi:LacI family transcriptional regulator